MKSYTFKVVLERDKWPDEPDEAAVWRAYVPVLEEKGVATFGRTPREALRNLQEVLEMVLESMVEHGEPIPEDPPSQIQVTEEPRVTCTI